MSSSSSPFTYRFTPMPRPHSANAPSFDGKNLTDFLDILLRHGEHAGLTPDQLTPILVSYCTPEVQHVVRYLPELQRDARSWHEAVSELRELYGSDDGVSDLRRSTISLAGGRRSVPTSLHADFGLSS
ncbi:hypothetical protein B0H13DRAFT_2393690 [Mycena leptocephala]|nr:hypothetical protein B0H13DRAFT_2393690 [Mycena leptocephala]